MWGVGRSGPRGPNLQPCDGLEISHARAPPRVYLQHNADGILEPIRELAGDACKTPRVNFDGERDGIGGIEGRAECGQFVEQAAERPE